MVCWPTETTKTQNKKNRMICSPEAWPALHSSSSQSCRPLTRPLSAQATTTTHQHEQRVRVSTAAMRGFATPHFDTRKNNRFSAKFRAMKRCGPNSHAKTPTSKSASQLRGAFGTCSANYTTWPSWVPMGYRDDGGCEASSHRPTTR